MKKLLTLLLLAGIFAVATAQTTTSTTKAIPAKTVTKTEAKATEKAVKIENTKCPVMGNDVNPKVQTVEYKGKNYGFCCGMCPEPFKKDPEKYLKNLKKTKAKATKSERE